MQTRPPVSLTRFVGREREIGDVERLVDSQRLVTLTGVGGAGKTRLAAELALRLDWRQRDSVAWVELATCNDPLLVAQQTASALGMRDDARTASCMVDTLRDRELLLVLDTCEHVIEATASLAATLLGACPKLRILATSREPLGVAGERVWPVPPLTLPDEAVELFVERASAVDPSFTLTEENRGAVVEICRRLDGIPLAIELAAARVRVLTPEQMTARLEDRFTILTGGSRSTIARHRTLRAAIDWSFALLSEREQTLLARLSVFAGTFALESVEAICTDATIDPNDVLDLLSGLVDKSLVVASTKRGSARYSLLDSIRQYAAERLAASSDADEIARRHALAYLQLVRDASSELREAVMSRHEALEAEYDNVRAALTWAIRHEPDAIALPLAAAFRWYWYYGVLWSEGMRWLTRVLDASSTNATWERAAVLSGAGSIAAYSGELDTGRRRLSEAVAMWRALGDELQLALSLSSLSHAHASAGDLDAASGIGEESLALVRRVGSPHNLAYCITNVALGLELRGRETDADALLAEAEAIWSENRHPLGLPLTLNARARLALRRNDAVAAARFARAALVETRDRHDLWFSSRALRTLALTSSGDARRAALLLGAADAMLRAMATGMLPHEKSAYDALLARLRPTLGDDALQEALREGNAMSFEDACELALTQESCTAAETELALHVRDLGPLRIVIDGKPLVSEGRSSARARELLAFLAAHPDGRTREEVGVAFWPDATSEQVKNSFHVTLHRLRKLLGRADVITSEGGRYRVDPALPHAVESRRFEAEVTAALRRGSDPPALERALASYGGEYLQGEEAGDWCFAMRSQLKQLFVRGLFALGSGLEKAGKYDEAADAFTRLVAVEPLHEAAWRQLMICRARLGARSESLLLYRQLEERLRIEIASTPEPETRTLYRRLQQNETV